MYVEVAKAVKQEFKRLYDAFEMKFNEGPATNFLIHHRKNHPQGYKKVKIYGDLMAEADKRPETGAIIWPSFTDCKESLVAIRMSLLSLGQAEMQRNRCLDCKMRILKTSCGQDHRFPEESMERLSVGNRFTVYIDDLEW